MADLLISPEGYTTPGGVPRKLLAGVFLVVSAVAMALFLITSPDAPLMTGDQKARAELKKPELMLAQQKGSVQWVEEAASHAAAARMVRLADGGSAPAANPPGRAAEDQAAAALANTPTPPPSSRGALPTFGSAPERVGPPPSALDAAAIERERAARSAAATVFDEGGTSSGQKGETSLEQMPAELMRRMGGGGPAAEALAPLADAIKGIGGPAPAPSRADGERQWAREQSMPQNAAVLHAKAPSDALTLYQGTVIPCVLTRRINSDLPGVVTARVAMDVYDSRTSRRLLLPKGALLSGAYNNDVRHGQSRLQFAFTRLRMPDGATFDLPGATGSDAAGQAGIDGDVDRHFFRSFGAALLLGVLADQVTRVAALPNGGTSGQGGVSATGQVFIDTARAELERHKSIPPTVTVEEGSRINVEVVRDMAFDTAFERNRR
jgi:type IV secretion system protein VirB10